MMKKHNHAPVVDLTGTDDDRLVDKCAIKLLGTQQRLKKPIVVTDGTHEQQAVCIASYVIACQYGGLYHGAEHNDRMSSQEMLHALLSTQPLLDAYVKQCPAFWERFSNMDFYVADDVRASMGTRSFWSAYPLKNVTLGPFVQPPCVAAACQITYDKHMSLGPVLMQSVSVLAFDNRHMAPHAICDATVRSLANLRILRCGHNTHWTDAALPPSIEILDCGQNTRFTDAALARLTNLEKLICGRNDCFTDEGLMKLALTLKTLHCGQNTRFTDVGLASLGRRLTRLYTGDNANFTDAALKRLVKLRFIDPGLSRCKFTTQGYLSMSSLQRREVADMLPRNVIDAMLTKRKRLY